VRLKKFTACLLAAMFMLAMTAFAMDELGETDWGRGIITVTGSGTGKAIYKNKSPGQFKLTAQQAARMDAQRKLAEYINGVQVDSNSKMEDLALQYDVVSTRAAGLVKNAIDVGRGEYDPEYGIYTVTMQMKLYGGRGSVAEVAFLPFKDEPKVPFMQPTAAVSTGGGTYTGLVIDCAGNDITPVMSPVIRNANGDKIYGHENLDYDKIVMNGMASYADAVNDEISRSRAGNNPLVIKATGLTDLNSTPVVSNEDANKILAANKQDGFLNNCAVVFVR